MTRFVQLHRQERIKLTMEGNEIDRRVPHDAGYCYICPKVMIDAVSSRSIDAGARVSQDAAHEHLVALV